MSVSNNKVAQRNLAIELRPTRFDGVLGNKATINSLKALMADGRIPTALLFSGSTGVGKTTLSRCLAQELNAQLVEANAADDTGVDAARALGEQAQYLPEPGYKYLMINLDEAHQLTKQAQNALLKHVEDAPPTTIWCFCTTEPSKLIPTLRGRCVSYSLSGLQVGEVRELVQRGIDHLGKGKYNSEQVAKFADQLVRENITGGRAICMAVERWYAGLDPLAAIFGTTDAPEAFEIARATFKQDWGAVRAALSKATSEEAMAIRAVVVNYFKSILLKGTSEGFAARAIGELTATIPFDGPLGLAEVSARLYRICKSNRSGD